MKLREEIIKNWIPSPKMPWKACWNISASVQEPEEVEPTANEIEAIARGKGEIARGEVVRWRDLKKELEKNAL